MVESVDKDANGNGGAVVPAGQYEDDVHADLDLLGAIRRDSEDMALSSIDDPSDRSERDQAAGVGGGKEEVMARFMQSEPEPQEEVKYKPIMFLR